MTHCAVLTTCGPACCAGVQGCQARAGGSCVPATAAPAPVSSPDCCAVCAVAQLHACIVLHAHQPHEATAFSAITMLTCSVLDTDHPTIPGTSGQTGCMVCGPLPLWPAVPIDAGSRASVSQHAPSCCMVHPAQARPCWWRRLLLRLASCCCPSAPQ